MFLRRVAVLVAVMAPSIGTSHLLAQVVREKVAVEVLSIRLTARDGSGKAVDDLSLADLSLSVDGRPVAIDTLGRPSAGAQPSSEDPLRTSPRSSANDRLIRTLIFADEGDTEPSDLRVVYDELTRYLRAAVGGRREVLIARFDGGRLAITCPWTNSADRAAAALDLLRQHPTVNPLPSASQLSGSFTPTIWIETYREQLHQALLEALAVFPDENAERQLLVVSGGTALMRPNDLVAILACQVRGAERARLRQLETDEGAAHAQELERATFALWSRAANPRGDVLTMSDVVAKALEHDIAIIPVAAEAIDRGASLEMEQWSPVLVSAADRNRSGRISTAQVMMEIAASTGSEPILVPGRTAARLAAIESRPGYTLTFREPSGDHRYHRIELSCRRKGVTMDYRRGYRIPADEERALDTVVAQFRDAARGTNPLNASASLTPVESGGRRITHLVLRIEPPRETAPPEERDVECIAIGETAQGGRTEPVRWNGTARVLDGASSVYALATDLGVPYGTHRWSIAVRDEETGLTSFLLLPARP